MSDLISMGWPLKAGLALVRLINIDFLWMRDLDSNQGSPAYETGELPLLHPASECNTLAPRAGLEPATCGLTVRRSTD